jgi:hypothetical protein
MSYWEFAGKNGLHGATDETEVLPDGRVVTQHDPDNPAVLDDETIAYALRTSRQARTEFDTDFPNLDAESQERLTALIEENPRQTSLEEDPQDFSDRVQSKGIRSIPVRTAGPRGGKLWRT